MCVCVCVCVCVLVVCVYLLCVRARACVAGLGGCMACGSVTETRRRWNADCLMMWCHPTTQRQPVATLHTVQYRWGGALHAGDATLLAVDSCYRNHRTHHMLCTHHTHSQTATPHTSDRVIRASIVRTLTHHTSTRDIIDRLARSHSAASMTIASTHTARPSAS